MFSTGVTISTTKAGTCCVSSSRFVFSNVSNLFSIGRYLAQNKNWLNHIGSNDKGANDEKSPESTNQHSYLEMTIDLFDLELSNERHFLSCNQTVILFYGEELLYSSCFVMFTMNYKTARIIGKR